MASPLSKVKFERKPPTRRPRVVLSVDEVHKILENAKIFSPKILYPFLFAAAYTGARSGEVRKLKRSDIDFESGLIHFRKTKNGEDRSLRISGQLSIFLKEFLGSHDSEIAFPYRGLQTMFSFRLQLLTLSARRRTQKANGWCPLISKIWSEM